MAVTISQGLLTTLCRAVRSSADSTKSEVKELAEACVVDLNLAGVYVEKKLSDPIVVQALKLYCKGNYGYDSETDVRKFQEGYEHLKISMSLSGDYSKKEA